MAIPGKSHRAWVDIVTGKSKHQLKFLAAKVLLGRLVASVSADPTPVKISSAVDQLYEVYEKNAHMASVQEDLKLIFG